MATISAPALLRAAGSRSCARSPRASITTEWPARARWPPTIEPMAPAPRMAKSKSGMTRPLQRLGDVLHEPAVLGFGLGRVALQNPAVAADQEFLEVPADLAGDTASSPPRTAVSPARSAGTSRNS